MNKKRKITAKLGLVLLLLSVLFMIVLPFQAWATVATVDDVDDDGIINDQDNLCISEIPTGQCVPMKSIVPDLYIQYVPPSDGVSILPPDPFELIYNGVVQGLFNIQVHVISEGIDQDQLIAPNDTLPYYVKPQYAVKIKESLDASDGDLGVTQIGIPTQKRSGTVFTWRIRKDVDTACNLVDPDKPGECIAVNSAGDVVATNRDEIFEYLTKEVCAHEVFHALGRVVPKDRKLDYHYPMLGYIMDHHMEYKYSKKNNTVTWNIHDRWAMDFNNELVDIPQYK